MGILAHLRRMAHDRPHVADVATAAVVWAVALLTTTSGHHLRDAIAVGLAAVACGVLAVRRRWPYLVLLVSTVAAEAYLGRVDGGGGTLILAAPLIALYTVAESTDRRRALLVAGALVLVAAVFHTLARSGRWLGPENVALVALGGLAVAAGEASRNRRAYLAETVLRARERVTEERLRIARDLHDSVGHHLALINVQAGVAGHVLTGEPEPVRETLEQIRRSSRAALDELRDAVGLLRRPDEPAVAVVEPAVGLAALNELLAGFEASGLRVIRRGDLGDRPLPPATDVVAYRVVQESLTNVRKHAGPVDVRLTLRRDGDALVVEVENDGPPARGPGPEAHGLLGMRERVTALGGTFRAEPRAGGGFRVAARLPTEHPA